VTSLRQREVHIILVLLNNFPSTSSHVLEASIITCNIPSRLTYQFIVGANILILSTLVSSTAGLGKQLDTAESSGANNLQEEHIKSLEVTNNKYDPKGKLSELCIPPLRRTTRDLPQLSVGVHGLISS